MTNPCLRTFFIKSKFLGTRDWIFLYLEILYKTFSLVKEKVSIAANAQSKNVRNLTIKGKGQLNSEWIYEDIDFPK